MKHRKLILIVDAVINLILGVLLLAYSPALADSMGVPIANSAFYPNILGAIFIGITVALFMEALGKNKESTSGLGPLGAIAINLCGGLVLFIWLLSGNLDIPLRGGIFLWALDIALLALSCVEGVYHFRAK